MGDGGPLQIACFLVGADTSSGAIHATMVPESKKMDMPYVVAARAKWVRDLGYERFCLHGDKEEFFSCYWTRWQKNATLKDKTGKFYDKYHRHRAIRAMEQLRKHSSLCVEPMESGTLPRFIEISTAPTKNPKSETLKSTPGDAEQSTKRRRQEVIFKNHSQRPHPPVQS